MQFGWDEAKRLSNIRQHGIDFVDVPVVFDGYTVTVEDERITYDEPRYMTVGMVKGRVIVVVHTESEGKIRIISARKATRYEETAYLQKITYGLETRRRAKRSRH